MKKNIFFSILISASLLIGCNSTSRSNFVESEHKSDDIAPMSTEITAREAADNMGRGFNLGQMFENTQHEPTFAEARPKIDGYYALGFRNLRIPITWTEINHGSMLVHDADVGDINFNHPRVKEIIKIVDYALSLPGMYVVINAHHEKTLKAENKHAVLERIWADLSVYFKDRDYRLLYEILNEPHIGTEPNPPENVRYMTELSYNKIRAVDPKRIIIIGGNQWFAAHEMAITWPNLDQVGGGDDQYVMATFHHYNPWEHHGEDGDKAYKWTEKDVVEPMEIMEKWASEVGNDMPVYIGEWGSGWGKLFGEFDCNNTRIWYKEFDTQYASKRPAGAMPTAVWDDGGWFQIYSHQTDSFANNLHLCIVGDCKMTGDQRINDACVAGNSATIE